MSTLHTHIQMFLVAIIQDCLGWPAGLKHCKRNLAYIQKSRPSVKQKPQTVLTVVVALVHLLTSCAKLNWLAVFCQYLSTR